MKHLIVYDNLPQCPYAVIVQQMFLQFISLILFPHLNLETLELAISFFLSSKD